MNLANRYQQNNLTELSSIITHLFQLVGAALSVLWMVVHSVHGIMFKDLKQILRKEQCDASILLTANVPSAKKIIVHGPEGIILVDH